MVHEPAGADHDQRAGVGRRLPQASPPRRALAAVAAIGAVVLVAAGCGSASTSPKASPTTSGVTTGTAAAPQAVTGGGAAALQQAFVTVAAKVRPEVVQVTSTSQGTTDLGSGVIYDSGGDIVTNAHVVGMAKSFQITFSDGQTSNATLVGVYTGGDLAVIKVSGGKSLRPATFGDSKALQIGDITLAIGNPLEFSSSVTEGIVSFNGRPVSESNTGPTLASTVQTSAAINPGNSGGALVDLNGDVIGIPTLAATDQQQGGTAAGIGFAIPSDTVKQIVPQLISSGKVTNSGRAELGITAGPVPGNPGQAKGVVVISVVSGGPADKAGIKGGDLITAINGKPTSSPADLTETLSTLMPGQSAKVTLQSQGGGSRTVTVTLGQLPG